MPAIPPNREPFDIFGPAPTSRMSMIPLGTYADPNGGPEHLDFAFPTAVTEPINALMRLFGTPSHPGSLWEGPDYGVASDNPERSVFPNKQDMATLGATFYGGNALNPGRLVEGAAAHAFPEARALGYGDDTARWFLEGDKPAYTMGGADPSATVAKQYGRDLAAQMDAYPYMDSVMPVRTITGEPYLHRTWYKPGEEARAQQLSDLATSTNTRTKEHHRQIGLALGYPAEAVENFVLSRPDLLSDTGKPSIFGSALSPYSQDPRNSLFSY